MASPNDPTLRSWIDIPPASDFPIQNLPFGIFKTPERGPHVGIAIGGYVLDLYAASQWGFFEDLDLQGQQPKVFRRRSLNAFIRLGQPAWRAVRERVSELLRHDNTSLQSPEVMRDCLIRQSEVTMLRPVKPQNYTIFREQATDEPITLSQQPFPVGSAAHTGSLLAAGTTVQRPTGPYPDETGAVVVGPVQQLIFEAQVAFMLGNTSAPGSAVPVEQAEEYVFGVALLTSWQRRYPSATGTPATQVFGGSLSPWIITLDALEPYRVVGPEQLPAPLPYLQHSGQRHFDIHLEAVLQPAAGAETVVATANSRAQYWSVAQQIAQQTSSGNNLQAGDIYASGPLAYTYTGTPHRLPTEAAAPPQSVVLNDGSDRSFLEDGDIISSRGYCERDNVRLGFGAATATLA